MTTWLEFIAWVAMGTLVCFIASEVLVRVCAWLAKLYDPQGWDTEE